MAPSATPWMAAAPEVRDLLSEPMSQKEAELMKEIGLSPAADYGDRKTEAVFIGVGLDKAAMRAGLEDALLTDAEFAEGEAGWRNLQDVFFGGEFFELIRPPPNMHAHEHGHKQGARGSASLTHISSVRPLATIRNSYIYFATLQGVYARASAEN